MSKEKWNGKLLKEVVQALSKKEGFRFKEISETEKGVMAESEPSKLGNFLSLRTPDDTFFPAIYNTNHKGATFELADRLIRKKIGERFPIFSLGLHYNPANATPRKVAEVLYQAFRYYERIWRNLMSHKELMSLIEKAISKAEREEKSFKK